MKKKALSRLSPSQLGRLFDTVTHKADSAFGLSDGPPGQQTGPDPEGDSSGGMGPTCLTGPTLEQLGTWIGRYKLLSVLGEGGMGIVYLAEQEYPMRRRVALKVIKPGMDTKEVISRFEAERQALALLEHPCIAHVYNAGTTEAGRPYFAMEFVPGIPINGHCDKHKLTIEERLELFLQVCDAIQHAHQKGIMHRDIKPSNILVSIQDDRAVVKIIDFGIAKAVTQPLTARTLQTEQGRFVGTPEYMSPEQAEMTAQGVDTRTDIYSLGVVLYELLTGVLPFDSEILRDKGLEHIRQIICERDPKTPSARLRGVCGETSTKLVQLRRTNIRALGRKLHGDLDWITLKALEKDPRRRYATAHALAEDLKRHLRNEPITAAPPTLTYRLEKFVRRNRKQVLATIGIVILVLMTLVSAKLYRQNVSKTQRLAEEQRNLTLQKARAALLDAETHYAEGRYQLALKQVETSLELASDQLKGQLLEVRILADLGRTEEAFQILGQLEAEHPEEGVVYDLLAMLYVELGNDALVAQYRALAEKYASQSAEAFIVRARTAETLDDMARLLSEALNRDRKHYLARKMRTLTYAAMKDYENMERDADKMTFIQPQNPWGYALRAEALRQMKRYPEAIQNHNHAIELADDTHPDLAELYDQRRQTYFQMGDYERALADARTCVEKQPDTPSYKCGLMGALVALGRYAETDVECEMAQDVVTYHFIPWLTKFVAEGLESGRELLLPGGTETSMTVTWLRLLGVHFQTLQSKAHRLVLSGVAADYSPDGRQLVYARVDVGRAWSHETPLARPQRPSSKGIDIKDLESGTLRSLVSFGHFPRWSPDGQHIAFVKSPFSFRSAFEQIYVIPAAGGRSWHLGKGVLLGWSQDSKYIYYHRYMEDWFIYKKAFDDPEAEPERIIYSPSHFPALSPDEKKIAYEHRGEILITDLDTKETVSAWRLPVLPAYFDAAWRLPMPTDYEPIPIEWSPTGRELSIGTELTGFGFWIYDVETKTAQRALPGAVVWGRWSRDGTKMAMVIGQPAWEIWEVDIDPNRPTLAAMNPSLTREQHCRDLVTDIQHRLTGWPKRSRDTLSGRVEAFCCAGLGQEQETVTAMAKWLRSLSTWPETLPPTYWQMANRLMDCYVPSDDNPNRTLTLAAGMATLAQEVWAGKVLLGMTHYRLGSYREACAHLEFAEKLRAQSGAVRYPDHVAYTAMALCRLGRRQEAEAALDELRTMFQQATGHDEFQPLVKAEKVLAGEDSLLTNVWDAIEQEHLHKALTLLTTASNSATHSGSETDTAAMSARHQLALRFLRRGQGYKQRAEYKQAKEAFQCAATAAPWDAAMLDQLARFQAACSQAALRDGARAIKNATEACEMSHWDNAGYIDTLAAAYAEAGQFEQAIRWQRQAMAKLPEETGQDRRSDFQAKLRLYQSGRSYQGQYLAADGLVAHYDFNNADGKTVRDNSGHGIDGTLIGNARVIEDALRGNVLELDGNRGHVDCGDNPLFDMTDQLTLSSWIKTQGPLESWRMVISKGSGWTLRSWRRNVKFVCGVNLPGDIGVSSGVLGRTYPGDGRWHHVAGVYDGRTMTLYIDGQRDVSVATSGAVPANEYRVWIGANSHTKREVWKGLIDDVRIYNYALTAEEIKTLCER